MKHDSVEYYIKAAKIIEQSGVQNHQQARLHDQFSLDLNTNAWEKYLQDYPYLLLLQYTTIGFPLTLL